MALNIKLPDNSRRGPSETNRHRFRKQVLDVFGNQTSNGEFPVHVDTKGKVSSIALANTVTILMFGMDEHGWPYVRVTGNQNGWQLNGKQVQVGANKLNYLNISPNGRPDYLTNTQLDAKFYFQQKGVKNTEFFFVCWQSASCETPVNPLFIR